MFGMKGWIVPLLCGNKSFRSGSCVKLKYDRKKLKPLCEIFSYLYNGMAPEGDSNKLRNGSGNISLTFFLPSKPVERSTTSASNLVLSSNSIPPSQNHHREALLNMIFPLSASLKKVSGKMAI